MKKIALSIVVVIIFTCSLPVFAFQWVLGRQGYFPNGSVLGGSDRNAGELFVCRAGPGSGKLSPRNGICYVPYGGEEQQYERYEVLVTNEYKWDNLVGQLPPDVVPAAVDPNSNERLFVCRAMYDGNWTPGKYSFSEDICYISYNGKEIQVKRMVQILRAK